MVRYLGTCVTTCLVVLGVAAVPVAAGPPPVVPGGTKGALAWGINDEGELGDGTLGSASTPVEPFGLHDGVRQISAGGRHTVAVLDDGGVMAWGANGDGQLGDGTHDTHLIPLPVPGLGPVAQVSAGGAHTLALARDGTVWAWGNNSHGQLGDGTLGDRSMPVAVLGLTGITQVSAGQRFSLARRSDGTVWAWGENARGQLGNGTRAHVAKPILVAGLTGIVEVSAGGSHSLALQSNGRVWAWGDNGTGQLGDGTVVDHLTPAQMPVLTGVTAIAAGGSFSVMLVHGQPLQWGETLICNFGDGGSEDADEAEGGFCVVPREVPRFTAIEARDVVQISAGLEGVAIRSDRTVWQWSVALAEDPTPDLRQVPSVGGAVQVDAGDVHGVVLVDRPPVLQS
jgi:alpha-tubulin suppressor-like RCC1 family protein